MCWKRPQIVEVAIGLETNSYACERVMLLRSCSDCDWPLADGCANDIEADNTELESTSAEATKATMCIRASTSITEDLDSTGGI